MSFDLKNDPTVQFWQRFLAIIVMACVGAVLIAGTIRLTQAIL